jgi:hypothetical protein
VSTKVANLRWWLLVAAVVMSGLAVASHLLRHGVHGVGEAILAAALWVGAIWGFVIRSRGEIIASRNANTGGPDERWNWWNPTVISTHARSSLNRTLIICGIGVAIGVALISLNIEVGASIATGAAIVPFAQWRHTRKQ